MKVSSIWAWWLMMAVIVAAASAGPTWTVDYDSEEYSSFLNVLREALGTGTPVCQIPVTTDPPKGKPSSYVLVDLVLNDNTITLALRASDAYLVGYQDRYPKTNKLRANFFSDEYSALKGKEKTIFGNNEVTAAPKALPVASTYPDLVNKADVNRVDVSLGVPSLQTAFTQVYGLDFNDPKKNVGKVVAKFALIAIQMVAEAARFKYIEDQVIARGMYNSFKAGDLITRLENNWSKISEQYHDKNLKCKPNVTGFSQDEMKLGLLLYKGGSGLNLNDGHAALAFV